MNSIRLSSLYRRRQYSISLDEHNCRVEAEYFVKMCCVLSLHHSETRRYYIHRYTFRKWNCKAALLQYGSCIFFSCSLMQTMRNQFPLKFSIARMFLNDHLGKVLVPLILYTWISWYLDVLIFHWDTRPKRVDTSICNIYIIQSSRFNTVFTSARCWWLRLFQALIY